MALRISSHTQLSFPKISGSLVSWKNMLCNKKDSIEFSLGDPCITYTKSLHTNHLGVHQYTQGLLVEINKVPASIWFTSWPMERRLTRFLSGKKLSELPVDLRAELLEAAYKPLLSAILFHTNTQIRVLNFLNLKPSEINEASLGITLRDNENDQESKMVILMHDKLIPVMKELLVYWPIQVSDFWHNKNTATWLQAGTIELSSQDLVQLEPSDILIMDASGGRGEVYLRLGSDEYFTATINSNQLTLDTGVQKMTDEHANDEAIASIDEIPVRLTFDLGDLVMPFKEVQSLTQGTTIDLNVPITHAVTIRSLNRVIGTGELVDIDDQMGVRIVKLFSKGRIETGAETNAVTKTLSKSEM